MKEYFRLLALYSLIVSSHAYAKLETSPFFEVSEPVDLGECGPSHYAGALDTFDDRHCAYAIINRVKELIDEVLDAHYERGLRVGAESCRTLPSELKGLLPVSNRINAQLKQPQPSPASLAKNEVFNLRDCP